MLIRTDADHVTTVTLDRPEVRNAFNADLIAALHRCFTDLATDAEVRVVVLTGAGTIFSAGADITWMQQAAAFTQAENERDARALAEMLAAVDCCPRPVIGRVNGTALGGAIGLIACCDIAIAAESAWFAFSEARLGIVPATIAPFVLGKIGVSQARALFLTSERFDAARARAIGLIHEVVAADALDAAVARQVSMLQQGGPEALAAAKALVRTLPGMSPDEQIAYTANMIAERRTSAEGQEGLRAFLSHRSPAWTDGR